jgi:hypothetical protein
MISLRADVRLAGLKTEMLLAMVITDRLCERAHYDVLLTSGAEGQHSEKSLHYVGYAFDFVLLGIKGDVLVEYRKIKEALAKALERDFDVVMETQPLHLHVEYQPKRGYQTID